MWVDVLDKDRDQNRSRVLDGPEDEGRTARVEYRLVGHWGGRSKVELRPQTGRSHQLRVQLANRGLPIVGDLKYGASAVLAAEDGHRRIALHARELRFEHPTRGEEVVIVAPVPADWPEADQG